MRQRSTSREHSPVRQYVFSSYSPRSTRCRHDVRLMPPGYVKPYAKHNKHDAADAEAVCEAVRRPSMRFVPIKTAELQAALVAHSVRDLLVRQRTMLVNALRGHLAEFGIVAPRGIQKVEELAAVVADESDERLPANARNALRTLAAELAALDLRITRLETEIVARAKTDACPTPRHDPRHRSDHRLAPLGDGSGPFDLPIGSRLRRVDRAGAAAKLDGRQAPPRRHLQTRQR
jgi:hypothetical protein